MTKLIAIALIAAALCGCESSGDAFDRWGRDVLEKNEKSG